MDQNVEWINYYAFMENLTNNKLIFSVDRLFFPKKSHLIAAYIIVSISHKVILRAKFIITVSLEYCHCYIAKLYGSLTIFVILHETVPVDLKGMINISISTDY